jgi:MinD superfamily P-loop ATPase
MEIAIISGKGGTGKSSISAAFSTLNNEVLVADCDVDAANLYLLFNPSHEEEEVFIGSYKGNIDYTKCTTCGNCIDVCRFDAISYRNGNVVISEPSCDGCFLCSRICPENAITMVQNNKSRMYSGSFRNGKMVYGYLAPGEENSGKLVNMIRNKARQLARANSIDTIILDGPPGIGCPVISTITGASKVIVITEPTVSGLHDMQRAIDLVQKFNLKVWVIINKYDLNPGMSDQISEWCMQKGIFVAGHLQFEPEIIRAMVQGRSITEWNMDLLISKEINKIWNEIIKCE